MAFHEYDHVYKIVVIGDSTVGKTSLISRFTQNEFDLDSRTTIGVEFSTKTLTVDDKIIKAQIWDTAGQERYRAIAPVFYRGATGALVVYDVTKHRSYEDANRWLNELLSHVPREGLAVMLVGNKVDLKHLRTVPHGVAKDYAESNSLYFVETSALDSTNVAEAFTSVIEGVHRLQERKQTEAADLVIVPDADETVQRNRCCKLV